MDAGKAFLVGVENTCLVEKKKKKIFDEVILFMFGVTLDFIVKTNDFCLAR